MFIDLTILNNLEIVVCKKNNTCRIKKLIKKQRTFNIEKIQRSQFIIQL